MSYDFTIQAFDPNDPPEYFLLAYTEYRLKVVRRTSKEGFSLEGNVLTIYYPDGSTKTMFQDIVGAAIWYLAQKQNVEVGYSKVCYFDESDEF